MFAAVTTPNRRSLSAALAASVLFALGCHQDMYEQPSYQPLEASSFFDNGLSSRHLVPGTVARGQLTLNPAFYTGEVDGQYVTEIPLPVTAALLERGQQRFNIYCSVCHGRTGDGDGMIVLRGYSRPPSYHTDRLRGVPVGHFFAVITHGFGAMPPLDYQLAPEDRWAVAAYLRALQLSQYADPEQLAPADRAALAQTPDVQP